MGTADVHPHIEWAVKLVREPSHGVIDLHAAQAQIGKNDIDTVKPNRRKHFGQTGEMTVMQAHPSGDNHRFKPPASRLQLRPVKIKPQQKTVWCRALQKSKRVAAETDGQISHNLPLRRPQRGKYLGDQYGNVRAGGRTSLGAHVFLQWEVSRAHLPVAERCEVVGCPIRAAFRTADARAGRAHFQLAPDKRTLLVTGASQGARTINAAVQSCWPGFVRAHPDWQLVHLTGAADEAAARAAYEQAGVPARVLAFTDEMHLAIAAADVVVSRAGASTLAELTALGRPAILLPYPFHRDMHQRANAQVLAQRGAAILLEDAREPEVNGRRIRAALDELVDPARRAACASAAAELGRPAAAERVAAWLLGQ